MPKYMNANALKEADLEDTFDYNKLRYRIIDLRRERGWTIEQLAKNANLTRLTVHYVENNKHKASIDTLYRLAKAFQLTISELLEGF